VKEKKKKASQLDSFLNNASTMTSKSKMKSKMIKKRRSEEKRKKERKKRKRKRKKWRTKVRKRKIYWREKEHLKEKKCTFSRQRGSCRLFRVDIFRSKPWLLPVLWALHRDSVTCLKCPVLSWEMKIPAALHKSLTDLLLRCGLAISKGLFVWSRGESKQNPSPSYFGNRIPWKRWTVWLLQKLVRAHVCWLVAIPGWTDPRGEEASTSIDIFKKLKKNGNLSCCLTINVPSRVAYAAQSHIVTWWTFQLDQTSGERKNIPVN